MFRSILGTTGSKILIAILGFTSMILSTRALGAEGFGVTGLITIAVTIILLVNSFVGGTALVYWASRTNLYIILIQSYTWAILVCSVFAGLIHFLKMVPPEYNLHVVALAFIFSLASVNLNILLGKQKIKSYNTITVLQTLSQLIVLIIFYKILEIKNVMAFVYSMYVAYSLTFTGSFIAIAGMIRKTDFSGWKTVLFQVFKFGAIIQVSYFIAMLNYRLSYYIIKNYLGVGSVGLFHAPNQLAEGTWVIGRSIATVQYSTVSNTTDKNYARRFSLNLLKLTFVVTVLVLGCMLAIPDSWYSFLGKDFATETRTVIMALSVGIVMNACSMMFSHYFSGLGKPQFNFFSALTGLVFTLGFGYWLIPTYGIIGAGITASLSYTASTIYLVIVFFWHSGAKLKELWISRADVDMIVRETRKLLKKKA